MDSKWSYDLTGEYIEIENNREKYCYSFTENRSFEKYIRKFKYKGIQMKRKLEMFEDEDDSH